MVSRDDHVITMADQYFSDWVAHEIISKEEAHEYFSEAANAFMKYAPLKVYDKNDNDLKDIKRKVE